jgi:cytochrome c553
MVNTSFKVKLLVLAIFIAGAASLLMVPITTGAVSLYGDHLSSPRTLYVQNCARCHGGDGKANTTLGRKYKADDISGGTGVNKTIRIVTNGKGHMPSFKKRLTAAQIAQIANYVSSL